MGTKNVFIFEVDYENEKRKVAIINFNWRAATEDLMKIHEYKIKGFKQIEEYFLMRCE